MPRTEGLVSLPKLMEGMEEMMDWRTERFSRRQFLVAGGSALAGSLLARTTLADATSPKTLVWANEFADKRTQTKIHQYFVQPFARHHGAKIQIEILSSNLDQQLKLLMASGKDPDIYDENGPSWIPPFYDTGHALVLDEFDRYFHWKEKILPWCYEPCVYNGHLITVPDEYESLHLWYNVELFHKHDWKIPTDWKELTALCAEIQAKGIIPFAFGSQDWPPAVEWWMSYAFNAYVGPAQMYQVLTGRSKWTEPEVAEAMVRLKYLWQKGWIGERKNSALTVNGATGQLAAGKAAMKMEGTWMFSSIDTYHFRYGVDMLPMWNNVANVYPIGIGEVTSADAKTKNRELAGQFLNVFVGYPALDAPWVDQFIGAYVPCIKIPSDMWPKNANPLFKKVCLQMQDAMAVNHCGYLSWTQWPAKTEAYMWNNLMSVWEGSMTVQDFLRGTQQVFDQERKAGQLPVVTKFA